MRGVKGGGERDRGPGVRLSLQLSLLKVLLGSQLEAGQLQTKHQIRSTGAGAGAGAPRLTPIKEDDTDEAERCKTVPAISSLSKGKLTDLKLSCLCQPASCSQDSDMSFLYK